MGAGALVVALLGVGVTACGEDAEEASAPSTADFCAELQQGDEGDDTGPYAEFYEKHPEPSPADWAADGHLVTESLQAAIDEVEAVDPSEEAKPLVADVIAALEVGKQNSIDISAAGAKDDQAAIDELERVNQDTNVPALMAAIQAVGELCAATAES